MNGVDLLFIVIGLLLLFVVWEIGMKYHNWAMWDYERRRQRLRDRYILQDKIDEKEYIRHLRILFVTSYMSKTIKKMTSSFDDFNKKMAQLTKTMNALKWE